MAGHRLTRATALLAGLAAVAHAGPALAAVPGVAPRLLPRLAGVGPPGRISLTFDDGPDPVATPQVVEVLAAHRVRATFFVLGAMLARSPRLGVTLAAAGHDLGVHGWDHRSPLRRGPVTTYRDLARTYDLVTALTGRRPRHFRPAYGMLTGPALVAARRLGLRPVLWTAWGRDWTASATADSVLATVRAGLTAGGTVLLHDSDCAAAPGAWRATLAALPRLLDECADRGWRVGPLDGDREPGIG